MKKLLMGVAACLNLIPGFLVLQKNDFIPPYSTTAIFVIISTFISSICFLLVLFNKDKIKALSNRKINYFTIIAATIFVVVLSTYSILINTKVKKDDFGAVLLPIVNTDDLSDKIVQYKTIDNYVKTAGTVRVKMLLSEDAQADYYVELCELTFILLYSILNALLVLSVAVISIRLSGSGILNMAN